MCFVQRVPVHPKKMHVFESVGSPEARGIWYSVCVEFNRKFRSDICPVELDSSIVRLFAWA